jgi:hypothetical protein
MVRRWLNDAPPPKSPLDQRDGQTAERRHGNDEAVNAAAHDEDIEVAPVNLSRSRCMLLCRASHVA